LGVADKTSKGGSAGGIGGVFSAASIAAPANIAVLFASLLLYSLV
jgi:hypothetical protein